MTKNAIKKRKSEVQKPKNGYFIFHPNIWTVIFFILVCVVLFLVFDPTVFTGGDNAHYWALAESITKGNFLRLYEPGTPPETATPFGFPLMLAPFYLISPDNDLPATIVVAFLSFVLGLYLSYLLFRLYGMKQLFAFGIVFIIAINIRTNEFSHWLLTDAPSLFFVALTVYLFEKSLRDGSKNLFILASLSGVASVYVRLATAPLIVGLFLFLFYKKDWKRLWIFTAISFMGLLPWFIWMFVKGAGYNFYIGHLVSDDAAGTATRLTLKDYGFRLWSNFKTYTLGHIPNLFFSPLTASFPKLSIGSLTTGLMLAVLWIIGFAKSFRKKELKIVPFVIIPNLVLLFFWENPGRTIVRYLLAISPLILFAVFDGILFLGKWIKEKPAQIIAFALIAASVGVCLKEYIPTAKRAVEVRKLYKKGNKFAGYHPAMFRYVEACFWIKNNTPENAIVVSRKDRLTYFWGKRRSFVYKFVPYPEKIITQIDSMNAQFVIVDRFSKDTYDYLIPTIKKFQSRFELVFRTAEPETYVFKILPKNVAEKDTSASFESDLKKNE